LRLLAFPWGRSFRAPSDHLGHRVSRLMLEASPARDRLTGGSFLNKEEADPVGRLELALDMVAQADAVEAKLRSAVRSGALEGLTAHARVQAGLESGVISVQEADLWTRYNALRRACIMVDDFPQDIGRSSAAETAKVSALQEAMLRRTA
jgi:acyl-CoA dehydrogenase